MHPSHDVFSAFSLLRISKDVNKGEQSTLKLWRARPFPYAIDFTICLKDTDAASHAIFYIARIRLHTRLALFRRKTIVAKHTRWALAKPAPSKSLLLKKTTADRIFQIPRWNHRKTDKSRNQKREQNHYENRSSAPGPLSFLDSKKQTQVCRFTAKTCQKSSQCITGHTYISVMEARKNRCLFEINFNGFLCRILHMNQILENVVFSFSILITGACKLILANSALISVCTKLSSSINARKRWF